MYRERPVMRTRMRPYVSRRRRRWDAVSWWFSLLFVIPTVLILGTVLWNVITEGDSPSTMVLKITDVVTGQALAGAEVRAGDQIVTTNDQGEARIALPAQPMPIVVQHADYEPVHGEFDDNADPSQSLALRPTTIQGIVKDEKSGAAIAGAIVSLLGSSGPTGELATTGEDGSFRLRNVPPGARLRVEAGDYGVIEQAIDGATQIDVAMRQASVTGRVVDADGNPLSGAVVASEANPDAAEEDAEGDGARSSVNTPREIKAIYISAPTAGTPAEMERLIQLIEETELNAVVLDIKESSVFYETQVEFFRDAEIVQPLYDAEEILRQLHEHDIYVIARLVVFKDPMVAENRPDLAIKDETTGGVWRDFNGAAWVNPIHEELWDANIALAVEAAELGFDEIQYDYIRFPSDGDLSTADFGFDYSEEARVQTIVDFLKRSHEALQAAGVPLAADVFGIIAIYPDDQGIGQRLADIAPYVDYICPMIYPSHFDASSIDVGGEPNDMPYETIELSLALAAEKMPGMEGKLRPWLQDFFEYESDQVRAQIDATEESAASGWMIWDPSNQYSDGAFAAED